MKKVISKAIRYFLTPLGYELKKITPEMYLHQYKSYEDYKKTQVFHNKRKIDRIWADEATLDLMIERIISEFGSQKKLFGLCHGTRNGFEQNYLLSKMNAEVIGTDISDTASKFPNTVQWDYHDEKKEWLGQAQFVYTNSLDQSWQPKVALKTWLNQLAIGGLLFIEHTHDHGPQGASEMDPFGVKPEYMPYLLNDWFGHTISVEIIKNTKSNYKIPVWLFVIKKLK